MSMSFPYAICNETFTGWDHARACDVAVKTGYHALEVAPFTLAPLMTEFSPKQRADYRNIVESSGLEVLGLHWLLAKTEGFQVTSPDPKVRQKTADYIGELAQACQDLGGHLMVFGSPLQRKIPSGHTVEQAREFFVDTLNRILPALEKTEVSFLLEPLSNQETDFLLTSAEACSILDDFNHPLLGLHLDVKAMSSESIPIPQILQNSWRHLRHFHANDSNLRGPGFGDVDFRPIFEALYNIHYPGWVSVEVFDYSPDPETIARESMSYMKSCEPV